MFIIGGQSKSVIYQKFSPDGVPIKGSVTKCGKGAIISLTLNSIYNGLLLTEHCRKGQYSSFPRCTLYIFLANETANNFLCHHKHIILLEQITNVLHYFVNFISIGMDYLSIIIVYILHIYLKAKNI